MTGFLDGLLNAPTWVVLGLVGLVVFAEDALFVGFVLPLFTLSYASGAFGTDRESRSLVWLMTRPIPRGGIYLAKFLGTLPWCVAFGLGGFVAVCMAGGAPGREALALYWPAAAVGTVAFASLFHLVGALFRRPIVIGLVYVFFFETVVAALPGSPASVEIRAGQVLFESCDPGTKTHVGREVSDKALGLALSRTYLTLTFLKETGDRESLSRCLADRFIHIFTVDQLNDADLAKDPAIQNRITQVARICAFG